MKNFFLAVLFLCVSLGIQAQEEGKVRFAGNLGLSLPNMGAGWSLDLLDVRYNIKDNLNLGVKFGGAMMIRDVSDMSSVSANATAHFNTNVMVESDYYFHNGTSAFAPFLGVGLGSFSIYDIYMQIDPSQSTSYTYDQFPLPARTVGAAIRGGFELGRLRLAMEYYIIPRTIMYDVANIMQEVGTSSNSYLTVNLGFYFGGGKWRRKI